MPYNIEVGDMVGWTAGGNISPARALKANGTTAKSCVQVTAVTDKVIGISGQYTRLPSLIQGATQYFNDGYHAISGEPVQVNNSTIRPCMLTSGAAFSANALLKTTTAGKGVAAGNNEYSFALALQAAGDADELVQVLFVGYGSRAIS